MNMEVTKNNNITTINLLLLCLYIACTYKSITKAAKALHVTQPTVTQAIKELEYELHTVLIIRSSRQFSLTNDGEILLIKVKGILTQINDIIKTFDGTSQKKQIRLGVTPTVGTFLFSSIICSYDELFSKIEFEAISTGSCDAVEKLKNMDLDIAIIVHDRINYPFLSGKLIKQIEVMYCVGCDHPLKEQNQIEISKIAKDKLILFREGYFLREKILNIFANHNIEPEVLCYSNDLSIIKNFISSNLASSFLLKGIAREDGIFSIHIAPPLYTNLFVVWNNEEPLNPQVKELIQFIVQVFSNP